MSTSQEERDAAKAKRKLIQKIYGKKPVETILKSDEIPKEANEKLDIALGHLKKYNLGSFLYYTDDDENRNDEILDEKYKDREDKLISELKRRGIPKEEHLPIIYHLIEDGYCVGYWNPISQKESGQDPNQIKITYRGILFKGYIDLNKNINLERRFTKIKEIILVTFTVLAAIGTCGLLILEILKFLSNLEKTNTENTRISIEKKQVEELYTQSIYREASTYQYEKELVRLRDSLGKRK